MTEKEFETSCREINRKLAELQSGEKETVSDETCAKAIIIVKNMLLEDIGDALLYAASLNALNTWIKQEGNGKKQVGYFFKSCTRMLARFLMEHPCKELKLEIQQDQGVTLLVAEICSLQFSFHQVPVTEENLQFLAKDMENPSLPWDGIRKQHNAETLFEFAWKNPYGRSSRMMDGTSLEKGMKVLLDRWHSGEITLSDLKKTVYGKEKTEPEGDSEENGNGKGKRYSLASSAAGGYPYRSKVSATLYESDFSAFAEKIRNRELVGFLTEQYAEGYGFPVPAATGIEWKYLFETLYRILGEAEKGPETGVRIEYVRGSGQEMIILILASEDEKGKINISLTELLSWDRVHLTDVPGIVAFADDAGEAAAEAIHPSDQIGIFLTNFTKGIRDPDNYSLKPCVFFYDASRNAETDIVSGYQDGEVRFAPVFYSGETEELTEYLRPSLSGRNGRRALTRIRKTFGIDASKTGRAEDLLYAKQSVLHGMNSYPSFLYIISGRTKSGKSSIAETVFLEMKKRSGKAVLFRENDPQGQIPADTGLVIYDDVIPETVDYAAAPYHILLYDPYVRTQEEKAGLLELKAQAEAKDIPVFSRTLTTAPGFRDLGCGNNWLIRHFGLGIIQPQEWNPALYPITVAGSKEELTGGDGIACVCIGRKMMSSPDGKILSSSKEDRVRLYREFAEGTDGVQLWIEDEKLKEKITKELYSSRTRYSWIERFLQDYRGDAGKLLEAQEDIIQNSSVRRKYSQSAIKSLGGAAWNKLSEKSRTWILSALLSYNDMKNYDQMMDFSGVVVQISKVIETELVSRISVKYAQWIRRTFGENCVSELPDAMAETRKGKRIPADEEAVTLGSLPYIMGMDGSGRVNDRRDRERFCRYAKEALLADPESDPGQALKEIARIIDYVRVNFRNRAAHKEMIDIVTAKSCIDYSIMVERKIGVLLDLFRE